MSATEFRGTSNDQCLRVASLGVMPYAEALELQRDLAARKISGELNDDVLLLVEHPHVVTLGRSSKQAHLIATPELLAARNIELFEVERGGDVTYHGPGQLVGYPIFDLRRSPHRQDLHWYLRQVEQALIDALQEYSLTAIRSQGFTGVWLPETERAPARKIASIGVHAKSWVTWHGFALNVATDLSYFDVMVPCGIDGVTMTSLANEGRSAKVSEVSASVVRGFETAFQLTAIPSGVSAL